MTASEDGAGVSIHSAWIQKKKEIVKREIKARGLLGKVLARGSIRRFSVAEQSEAE